jgi:hypothetical protein
MQRSVGRWAIAGGILGAAVLALVLAWSSFYLFPPRASIDASSSYDLARATAPPEPYVGPPRDASQRPPENQLVPASKETANEEQRRRAIDDMIAKLKQSTTRSIQVEPQAPAANPVAQNAPPLNPTPEEDEPPLLAPGPSAIPQVSPNFSVAAAPGPPNPPASSPPERVAAASPTAMPAFPWPPPAASAWDLIPNDLLLPARQSGSTFDAIDERLTRALDDAGYHQRSYFTVPGGFALVTQLERIEPSGASVPEQRWLTADVSGVFSLEGYFKRLLYADPGRYRLVVLVVSDVPFSADGGYLTQSDASKLLSRGVNTLPEKVAENQYSSRHRCTALIYEFRKSSAPNSELVVPSPLPGRDHLMKARIWAALTGAPKN